MKRECIKTGEPVTIEDCEACEWWADCGCVYSEATTIIMGGEA